MGVGSAFWPAAGSRGLGYNVGRSPSGDSHSVTDLVTEVPVRRALRENRRKGLRPASIGQYRVVTRDTIKVVTEKAGNAGTDRGDPGDRASRAAGRVNRQ